MNNEYKPLLRTSTWILTIIIVVLLQFITLYMSSKYGPNQTALGYISFAGTLVSIILAVLAIVYSFYQSYSQQSSSEILSKQLLETNSAVTNLNKVVNDMDKSNESLNEILSEVKLFSESLSETNTKQEEIKQAFLNITLGHLDNKVNNYENISKDELSKILFDETYIFVSFILYFAVKYEIEVSFISSKLLWATLDKNTIKVEQNYYESFFDGSISFLLSLFKSKGIFQEGDDRNITTSPEVMSLYVAKIDEVLRPCK